MEFNANISIDTISDYEDLRYYWDFGDGTVGRGKGLHHSYPESGLYPVKLLVVDDDGASSSVEKFIEILNTPPIVAILDEDLILWEGETHVFAVDSADSPTDFQRLHYYWSSGESGWQSSHAWTDDWEGQVSVQVQDPEGLTAIDTINVAVLNVPPKISLSKAYMEGNLTLRAAGTPKNAITLKVLGNGIVVANFTLDRIPGDPKSQAITLPFLFDLAVEWRIEISYCTKEIGANPTWLTFTTSDHRSFTYFHNFVVEQESTWTWNFYPKEYLFSWGWPIIFNGTIFDPSSDSITGQVLLNSNPILDIFHPADGSWPAEIPFSVSIKASNSFQLEVTAADDDGGTDYVKIDVENFFGRIFIRHLAPQFEISVPTQIFEDFTGEFLSFVYDVFPPEDLLYVWNFGDGTSLSGANISHTYSTSGSYVVQLTIQNPYCSATRGYLIQVVNYVPYVDIFGLSEGPEDEVLKFEAQITETSSDKLDLHYFWTFGDGYSEVGPKVTHSYAQSNSYTLTLAVCDDNGAVGTQTIPIIIYDEAPIIDGPFGFQTVEGNTILAEVDVYDSVVDEPYLLYSWKYNSETIFSRIFTTREDDGAYNAIFTVVDPDTTSVTNEISLVFINQPPSISASSFLVYGARTSLDLKAFASDSYVDMADLTYEWVLDDEPVPDGQGIFSSITLNCDATRTYIGHVAVTDDSSHQSYSDFTVYVFLDSDGDGMTNEFEIISGSSPDQSDTDGDLLPDSYEYETTHTSANNRDTDGDGLWDGLDPTANTGEVILGTNPLNPDTDGDGLTDWEEIIVGWTVTVNGVSGPVYSNPLKIDTDSDGLTDYQEKNPSGTAQVTDPTKANTDGDEQSDFEEAGLAVAIDSDQDGVSDDDERTHITEYVPVKHEYFLTSDSAWVNALELTGSLESTQVDDANSWRGQALGQPSPLTTVTFTGVFDTIITQYNEFVINMSVSAADAAAYFQLWDGDSWVTHTTFSETTTNAIIVVRITEENAADWIHGETLQFRLVSGNNKDELNPDLCNSYLEIFYAHIEGFLKYTLRSDSLPASSWVNAEEIQGTLANTFIDDANSWSGQTKAQTPPLPIIFTGVFNSITTPNNRLTVRVRVSATDSAASFQLWNGEVWDDYKTFSVSTTAYVTLNEPTVAEYIHDGTLMFRIVSGYNKKSNGMVFFESYVEILYALIEEITTQEIFRSDPALADTDGDGLSDGEEYYPGNDGWTTNPRNPDTDHDHLLDSAESVSLTREYGTRERFSRVKGPDGWGILESFFPLEFTLSTSQEFFFDAIINGGQAKNATVFVGFSSTTDLRINHILIKVAGIIVAEELNPTLDEPAGGLEGTYFFKGYDITQKTTRFSGEWWLLIDAEPLHPEDCEPLDEYSILLEEFKGEILMPLNPTNPDWDQDGLWDGDELNASVSGWLTNPRNWDSDGDMWSDCDEIYKYTTNPLSADTDGDGAIDPDDHDPLYDLVLQINVFQGHFDDADWTRRLAVVLKVGKEALATPDKWADSGKILKGIFKREVFRTATFNYEYYFDINDDLATVDIGIELWKISWVWDTRLLTKSYTYSVGTATDANPTGTVTVADGDGDWVTFAASTRALQRVNTLAIYAEGNFYNGHYPAIERFTVIILRVEGTPDPQDPIKAGVNVILMPVSIFIRTHLHALLESGNDADLVELGTDSASGIAAEFYGIDPTSETVSQYVEGLVIKGLKEDENGNQDYVTPAEALAILNYVLCDETGELTYSAYLCDEVGMVERLGLAEDILDLVPLDAESMKNDPLGAMPKGFWDWLGSIFLSALKFILLIALAPILLTIVLVAALIYIGITLLGDIFEDIVLAIIKVIIIVFIFIMFALTLLSALISFLIIALVISLIAVITQQYIQWGFLYIEFNLWNIPGRYELRVEWEPNDFLKISVPVLVTEITLAGSLLSRSVDRMGLGPAEDIESITPQELISLEPASPILDPMWGDSTTIFTFTINYTGPDDTPPDVNLYLLYESSGQVLSLPYDMVQEDLGDTIYSDGCIFKKEIPGTDLSMSDSFSYYIEALYSDQQIRYPEEGYGDGPFIGEIVLLPVDSEGVLTPISGGTDTIFTYRIKYIGPNGINPTVTLHFHYINAEGFPDVITYVMAKETADETYSDGVIYTIQKGPFAGGQYSYHIEAEARDDLQSFYETARYPAFGVKEGPSVTEIDPLQVANMMAMSMYLVVYSAFFALTCFIFSTACAQVSFLAFVGLGVGMGMLIFSLIHTVRESPDPSHKAIGSMINAFLCLIIWLFLFSAYMQRDITKGEALEIKNSVPYILLGVVLTILSLIAPIFKPILKSDTIILIDTIAKIASVIIMLIFGMSMLAKVAVAVLFGSSRARGGGRPGTKPFQKTCFQVFLWCYLIFCIIYMIMYSIYKNMATT